MRPEELLEAHGAPNLAAPLREFVLRQRWFGGRDRTPVALDIEDAVLVGGDDPTCILVVAAIRYADRGHELYSVPLSIGARPADPASVIAARGERTVSDGLAAGGSFAALLWRLAAAGGELATCRGRLRAAAAGSAGGAAEPAEIRSLSGEQSNSSLVWADREFMKVLRRLEPGPSIELEVAAALEQSGFSHMAHPRGSLHLQVGDGPEWPIGLVQTFVGGGADGWRLALRSMGGGPDTFATAASELGMVTAEMHLALASPALTGDVAARPVTTAILAGWAEEMDAQLEELLASADPAIAPLRRRAAAVRSVFDRMRSLGAGGLATRVHGDYHLGQVLRTDAGWVVLDFEGEPRRPPEQRRRRYSPLRDVAGMLRSFHYAAAAHLAERVPPGDRRWPDLQEPGDAWQRASRKAFWSSYADRVGGTGLLPEAGAAALLRQAFEVDKAVYEVRYELGHRGADWAGIPLAFLLKGGIGVP